MEGADAVTITMPMCMFCSHLRRDNQQGNFCDAFPDGDGIPGDIMRNEADHRRPFIGDHGVRFKPINTSAAATVVGMFEDER